MDTDRLNATSIDKSYQTRKGLEYNILTEQQGILYCQLYTEFVHYLHLSTASTTFQLVIIIV